MARIGAFCFPGTGHLNPMTALLRRLQQRGHSVVLFGIPDVEARVRAAGIEFCLIGQSDFPLGTLQQLDLRLSQLQGLPSFRFTLERICNTARMVLRDGPEAARRAGIEAFLIDEADFGGNVADYLGLPRISIAIIPPMVWDNRIPPYLFGWSADQRFPSRLRNELAMRFLGRVASPILTLVNQHRKAWGLEPQTEWSHALSTLAQVAQLPAALEFDIPMRDRHPVLHYTGPWVDAQQRPKIDFPWDQLDGRPLVYATLGTLQNGSEHIFRTIAAACADLPVQLVITLGGGLDSERLGTLASDPIVVSYAPQLDLIKRSAVVITHAGINTALESLAEGVPLVCTPIGNDQPGVAARVAARGAGLVVPMSKLSTKRLHSAVRTVFENDSYRRAARQLQASIQKLDGLGLAADIIEDVLKIGPAARA
ncbi:MAG: nucleotide disphospho-sugar-binding domain-containing protein [Tepidisphaeraceae bacterium]